eukprot:1144780-Pelagomonas_calceolata.AAC.2
MMINYTCHAYLVRHQALCQLGICEGQHHLVRVPSPCSCAHPRPGFALPPPVSLALFAARLRQNLSCTLCKVLHTTSLGGSAPSTVQGGSACLEKQLLHHPWHGRALRSQYDCCARYAKVEGKMMSDMICKRVSKMQLWRLWGKQHWGQWGIGGKGAPAYLSLEKVCQCQHLPACYLRARSETS